MPTARDNQQGWNVGDASESEKGQTIRAKIVVWSLVRVDADEESVVRKV